ncbi:Pleckstrin y domain-containing A member 6 [Balamuthia mandrillaris]
MEKTTTTKSRSSSQTKGNEIKEGWVVKQGPPPWKTWKKRWLVLTSYNLTYFKLRTDQASMKGQVPISSVTLCGPADKTTRKFSFKVDTPVRSFVFAAQSTEEMKLWLDAINNVCTSYKATAGITTTTTTKATTTKRTEAFRRPSASEQKLTSQPGSSPTRAGGRMVETLSIPSHLESATGSSKEHHRTQSRSPRAHTPRNTSTTRSPRNISTGRTPRSARGANSASASQELAAFRASDEGKKLRDISSGALKAGGEKVFKEMELELAAVRKKYDQRRKHILEELVKKEIEAVVNKYEAQRQLILEEIRRQTELSHT